MSRTLRSVAGASTDGLASAERLDTLEDVLAWTLPRGAELLDVIVQDEYTHDVIVRAGTVHLVFDTT